MKSKNLLTRILVCLNSLSENNYFEIYEDIENSVDFITGGESKTLTGISFFINSRIRLEIRSIPYLSEKSQQGIKLVKGLKIRMKDFTSGTKGNLQNFDLYESFQHPFFFDEAEEDFIFKIQELHSEINYKKLHFLKLWKPSKSLEKLTGAGEFPKYEILDHFSSYILENNLRLSSGDIKIYGLLKELFHTNTTYVSENVIFEVLKNHTLPIGNFYK